MADWTKILQHYEGKPIAVYGLSEVTQTILNQLRGRFIVVGLMDSFRDGGSLYGYSILKKEDVFLKGTACIIVAARPGSCRAIERHIGKWCQEHKIGLVDIWGRDLLERSQELWRIQPDQWCSRDSFLAEAGRFEYISFDLFDTLAVRKVLYFSDLMKAVEKRLKDQGIDIDGFVKKRLTCETELSRQSVPTLPEIYSYMIEKYSLANFDSVRAAEIEWNTDLESLVPRRELCNCLKHFSQQGKHVCIITDSYYSRRQIEAILEKCNITGFERVLISNEEKVSKARGLFFLWKGEDIPAIHIGDDPMADVKAAIDSGLEAFQIPSVLELTERVNYFGLLDELDTWDKRFRVGLFAARIFNNPFQPEAGRNSVCVPCARDAGYLFFAPVLADFVIWLKQQLSEQGIRQILFAARDGFLIKKMFDQYCTEVQSLYFLTSRTASVRAGVDTEQDLCAIERMRFSGSVKEQLLFRFGLDVSVDGRNEGRLSDYKDIILSRCSILRRNYKKYIERLSLRQEDTAFFDFVSKGTSQFFLERIMGHHLKGFYFMRPEKEWDLFKDLNIRVFCEMSDGGSELYQNYSLIESILTSPASSVLEFDSNGEPVFEDECRTEEQIACINEVQEGILEYWNDINTFFQGEAKPCGMSEKLLSFIHHISVFGNPLETLTVSDPFYCRTMQVSDLIK